MIHTKILNEVLDNIHNRFKKDDDSVNIKEFVNILTKNGILRDDPRISHIKEFISNFVFSERKCDKETFIKIISPSVSIIEKTIKQDFIIPDFEKFCKKIKKIFDSLVGDNSGDVANYIPQLAKQNPNNFAVSICTIDGQKYNIGDCDIDFCIQSCCKPINYCIALENNKTEIRKTNSSKKIILMGIIGIIIIGGVAAGLSINPDSSNIETLERAICANTEILVSSTIIPGFPDPEKDLQHYLDRYNNEPSYADWFDRNFQGQTIQEAVC